MTRRMHAGTMCSTCPRWRLTTSSSFGLPSGELRDVRAGGRGMCTLPVYFLGRGHAWAHAWLAAARLPDVRSGGHLE